MNALKAPQVRGRWGEMTLKRVAELAGMVEYCDFFEQESQNTESGLIRPDMIVKLPHGKQIVVDSKTPLLAYTQALESDSPEEQKTHLKNHAKQLHLLQQSRVSVDALFFNAAEFKKKIYNYSVGLKISLPFEPINNPFVGVYATFHYFMVRKFFFGSLSSAFIACEGGWGTRDELFEILTLVQTGKSPLMPIIYVSPDPKHLLDDIKYCEKKGYISKEDLDLIDVVKDYKKAVTIINRFYSIVEKISYEKPSMVDICLCKPLSEAKRKKVENLVLTKYATVFEKGVSFSRKKVSLKGYKHKSYGVIKKIIEAMA